jgi:F-type H+-transporting ATPase subunit a
MGWDLSFTNSSLMMGLAVGLIVLFFGTTGRKGQMIPGRMQMIAELIYQFVANLARENIGKGSEKYVGLLLSTFLFILFGNLLGMVPYGFTFTSHIVVTFTLAFVLFLTVILIGLAHHGLHFFSYFFPKGTPALIAPFIGVVEMISFLSRPISLSVRLFANMIAGHIMLKIFASFTVDLGMFGVMPLLLNAALTAFEILVAAFQAYIFTVLLSLYVHDAVHLH